MKPLRHVTAISVGIALLLIAMNQAHADEIWDSRLGAWKSLSQMTPSTIEGGAYFKQDYANKKIIKAMGGKFRRDQFIPAHPNSRIVFSFIHPITEFRSVLVLYDGGTKGNVTYKVETEEGEIYKSGKITHGQGNHEKITLKFKPSRSLILTTYDNGDGSEDWAVWLAPDVK